MTMRRSILLLSLLAVLSLRCFPSTVDDLNTKIDALSSTATKTEADVNAAFLRIKTETHLDKGPLLVGGVIQAFPGDVIDWSISFVASSVPVSGLQAEIALPSSFTVVSIATGPAATAAGKTVSSNNNIFIVAGLNQTAIQSGVVAIARIQILSNAFVGFNTICLGAPVASDPTGKAILISATSGTVEVGP